MSRGLVYHLLLMGKEVKKEDNGRGGDGKGLRKNEILVLPVCPAFSHGNIVSGLNDMPETEKEVGG
jgi:hypothetical protein